MTEMRSRGEHFAEDVRKMIEDFWPPDRGSVEGGSPHKILPGLATLMTIKMNGVSVTNVVEYCVSEGWARVHLRDVRGRPKLERGQYVTVTKRDIKLEVSRNDKPERRIATGEPLPAAHPEAGSRGEAAGGEQGADTKA